MEQTLDVGGDYLGFQEFVQSRTRERRSLGMVLKEVDENLALFLEMRSRGWEKNDLPFHNSVELDDAIESKSDSPSVSKITTSGHRAIADDFIDAENGNTDYDSLPNEPGTPAHPSLEMEAEKSVMGWIRISNSHSTGSRSMTAYSPAKPASRSNFSPKKSAFANCGNSNAGSRRPSSSSRGLHTTSIASRATVPTTSKSSRPASPTSRAAIPSKKPTAPPVRSSTPTRPIACPSTSTSKGSIQAGSKSASKSATPKRRPPTPSTVPNVSASFGQSSSVTNSGARALKTPLPSQVTSKVKSRPRKPSEMPGFCHDTPSNLRTLIPERPASAPKDRSGAPSSKSTSTETSYTGKPRRKSCSPERGRAPNTRAYDCGSSLLEKSRGHSNGSDAVNPLVIGTKMVERVVNMRKLAPSKLNDHVSTNNSPSRKTSSFQDNSGFGRTLSKHSLDMALRHMDIRQSIVQDNICSVRTQMPTSYVYSVGSSSRKGKATRVSDFPLPTSENANSGPSVKTRTSYPYESEMEDNDACITAQLNGDQWGFT